MTDKLANAYRAGYAQSADKLTTEHTTATAQQVLARAERQIAYLDGPAYEYTRGVIKACRAFIATRKDQ